MTQHAKLVIVGAGIIGCSAAYHLAKLGWSDIIVVDKGPLFENDGSTSHAPGGVVALAHSKVMNQFAQYSSKLFKSLDNYEEGRNTYNAVGGIEMAISQDRMDDLIRLHGEAHSFHSEAHLLTPAEVQEKLPFVDPSQIKGGLFAPLGAIVAGWHVSGALARDAEKMGDVKFVPHTPIVDIEVKHGRVSAVLTDNPAMPRIECEQVLLCTNIWGPVLGDKIGVPMPLLAYEHQYVITDPLPELAQFQAGVQADEIIYPTMRELDSTMYYRQHWNAYGIGSYWHRPIPHKGHTIKGNAIHEFTPADFSEAWDQAQRIMPMLKGHDNFTKKFNGMFAFSVDGYPIMGESRHIGGLWTCVASWITHSGGVGKSIAEWMTHGDTEWDLRQANLHRFHDFQTTEKYISTVCNKNYREVYDIIHPAQPITEPRNVRLSPFHGRSQSLKADFTAFAGLELPNWFEENQRLLEVYDEKIPARSGWGAQFWSPIQGAEHLAVRENVAVFDLTGLSIIEVSGSGAVDFVEYLCSNRMDKPVGQVVYTLWLTPNGGVKRDLTVARMADDRFWMFVGEGTLPQDLDWVLRHAPKDGSVAVNDISNAYSAVGVWGPNARRVLEKVSTADLSHAGFPFYSGRWIDVGMTKVYAMRISYAGELGWELHIPFDASLPVWDTIWEAGREFNMIAAGMGAFDSLRLEKGYRLWGRDVYTEYNAYEAGMGWTVKTKKGDFIGREASIEARKKPLKKKLTCLTIDDPAATPFGYEPIFDNGSCIGHVTTANFGYSIGKTITYSYLPVSYTEVGTEVEIMIMGQRHKAVVAAEPLYDPKSAKMKR
ncbi:MAG: FAD-dependent oxidoreductase [Ardenticatenaceae bacterium]|nr:FAD-dependent oxidoreductase [Ardenticatenaceae bacterium]